MASDTDRAIAAQAELQDVAVNPNNYFFTRWTSSEIDNFSTDISAATSAAQEASEALEDIREIQESIPSDYSTLAAQVDTNKNDIDNLSKEIVDTNVWTVDKDGNIVIKCNPNDNPDPDAPEYKVQYKEATPTGQDFTLVPDVGYSALSAVLVKGDANLLASNIAKNVTIYGVTGTLESGGGKTYRLQTKSVTPTGSEIVVSPDSGYDALSSVTIAGDSNLVAHNIVDGVIIYGVTGTYKGSSEGGSHASFSSVSFVRDPNKYVNAGTVPISSGSQAVSSVSFTITE